MMPTPTERHLDRLRKLRAVFDHMVRNADERPGRSGPAIYLRPPIMNQPSVPWRDALDDFAVLVRMEEAGHERFLDEAVERFHLAVPGR